MNVSVKSVKRAAAIKSMATIPHASEERGDAENKFARFEDHYWRRFIIGHGVWLLLIAALTLILWLLGAPPILVTIVAGLAVAVVLLAALDNYLMDRA